MEYAGEHLLFGQIGNAFVILSFLAAIVSAVSYYFSFKDQLNTSWKRLARIAFRTHSLAVLGMIGTLFLMLFNHYFEYHYVWQHSNKEMPLRYIASCFWEGQEGSFLLWIFWHAVLGNILLKTSKEWEAPVMVTVSLVQAFLSSMLLGIYFLNLKIGSNPFTVLLREHPDFANIPLFQDPNYLQKLDGRGLNPLLQNYWMTIHPPTLFLGFAAVLIPFAYAIAGLWTKRFNDWQKPVLPWTFFGVMILGTGILMGGAWAYEALSFGGFWAWDPVENASLVPWLVLVGAAHVMLINKNKGGSLFTTFILTLASFILILYSTFLTRSGILGESSVHAFTDLGMSGQLLIYLLFFVWLAIFQLLIDTKYKLQYAIVSVILFILAFSIDAEIGSYSIKTLALSAFVFYSCIILSMGYVKYFPKEKEEEDLWSREFWMFIGATVLLISAGQIIFTTSIPVFNKLFNLKMAPPLNVIDHYNRWQIPFAILVSLLIAVGQFFKYQKTDITVFWKKISLAFLISLVATAVIAYSLSFNNHFYSILLFAGLFAVLANLDYFVRTLKGKIKKAGSSISHIGFALILIGALLSAGKKEIISFNTSGKNIESLGKDFKNNENILLTQGDTLQMGEYFVTYTGREKKGINIYFNVNYLTKDESGKYQPAFTLQPLLQINPRMGNVSEPDTRHFWDKDIYTHVTFAEIIEDEEGDHQGHDHAKDSHQNEYNKAKDYMMEVGDTIFSSNSIIVLDNLNTNIDRAKYGIADTNLAVAANFRLFDVNKNVYEANPVYVIKNNRVEPVDAVVEKLGVKFQFWKIDPETGKIEISLAEKKSNSKDFIVMSAIIFPYINILWAGCIIMIIGTVIAIRERIKR